MKTYFVMRSRFGHLGLYRYEDKITSTRIDGDKPWGGGERIQTFRSRSDEAAIRRFNQ